MPRVKKILDEYFKASKLELGKEIHKYISCAHTHTIPYHTSHIKIHTPYHTSHINIYFKASKLELGKEIHKYITLSQQQHTPSHTSHINIYTHPPSQHTLHDNTPFSFTPYCLPYLSFLSCPKPLSLSLLPLPTSSFLFPLTLLPFPSFLFHFYPFYPYLLPNPVTRPAYER